jgi:hypothetical protein
MEKETDILHLDGEPRCLAGNGKKVTKKYEQKLNVKFSDYSRGSVYPINNSPSAKPEITMVLNTLHRVLNIALGNCGEDLFSVG